jgi:hypothetical protein
LEQSLSTLVILKVIKGMLEFIGFCLLGQGLVALFAGPSRHTNAVYVLLKLLTSPVTRPVRFVTKKFIQERFVGAIAFGILLWLWLMTIAAIVYVLAQTVPK